MSAIHSDLANGRFIQMSFCEQMANIGSEVERALNWKERNNTEYSQKAFDRAHDLIGIAMSGLVDLSRLKEMARIREALNDYFIGENYFQSTSASWRKYFCQLNCSSTGPLKRVDSGNVRSDNQRMNIMRALVRLHRFQVHQVPHDGVVVGDSVRSQNVPSQPSTLQSHPHIVFLQHGNVLMLHAPRVL